MKKRRVHRLFEAGVLLKGAHALIECLGGIALSVVSTSTIVRWVNALTQEELVEDPSDFIATHLRAAAQHLSVSARAFYALYLLGHGVIKLLLVVALIRNKAWAYPTSLVVLSAFIAYQLYRYAETRSPGLIVLSLFDVVVVALIWREWQLVREGETSR